jgi:hypothetical protein
MFVSSDLRLELNHHLEPVDKTPRRWLFPSSVKRVPLRLANFLRRVLNPAGMRARIAVRKNANGTHAACRRSDRPSDPPTGNSGRCEGRRRGI